MLSSTEYPFFLQIEEQIRQDTEKTQRRQTETTKDWVVLGPQEVQNVKWSEPADSETRVTEMPFSPANIREATVPYPKLKCKATAISTNNSFRNEEKHIQYDIWW